MRNYKAEVVLIAITPDDLERIGALLEPEMPEWREVIRGVQFNTQWAVYEDTLATVFSIDFLRDACLERARIQLGRAIADKLEPQITYWDTNHQGEQTSPRRPLDKDAFRPCP